MLSFTLQNSGYGFYDAGYIVIRGLPVADADAHGAAAAPGCAAKKCFDGLLDCRDDFISVAVVSWLAFTSGQQASKWD